MYSYITVPVITVFADVDLKKNPKGYLYLANRISKIAKEYLNKFVFVVANKKDEKDSIKDHGLPSLSGEILIPKYGIKEGALFQFLIIHLARTFLPLSLYFCFYISLSISHTPKLTHTLSPALSHTHTNTRTRTHTYSPLHSSLPLSPLPSPHTGKRDTGLGLKLGDMHYKSESLTFSAEALR